MWGAVVIIATAVSTITATSVAASPTSSDSKDDQRKKRNEWTYTFPVSGPEVFYPRDHLDYPAADLSGCRQLVRAPISGVVVDVRDTDKWDPAVDSPGTRGGLTITLHGDDFVRYYFSHLGRLMVKKGQRVESGQKIATVGQSGNAKTTLCHLHFGMSRICPMSEQNVRRGEIWPQPYLDDWKRGINTSPNREVQRLTRTNPTACLLAAAAQRRGGDG
jgi:murein DD-endopeptidase MepM/ murein hydrolase activator NlpD